LDSTVLQLNGLRWEYGIICSLIYFGGFSSNNTVTGVEPGWVHSETARLLRQNNLPVLPAGMVEHTSCNKPPIYPHSKSDKEEDCRKDDNDVFLLSAYVLFGRTILPKREQKNVRRRTLRGRTMLKKDL